MILQNFKISDDRKELIGISGKRMLDWLKVFASKRSTQKMYCLKIVEVNHSQLARNFLYMLIGEYADELGYSTDNMEKIFLRRLDDLIRSGMHDMYSREKFYDGDVIDPGTGEMVEGKLKTISKFTTSNMSLFIDLVIASIKNDSPDFIIPDPSKYMFEREGKRNEILFPDETIKLT